MSLIISRMCLTSCFGEKATRWIAVALHLASRLPASRVTGRAIFLLGGGYWNWGVDHHHSAAWEGGHGVQELGLVLGKPRHIVSATEGLCTNRVSWLSSKKPSQTDSPVYLRPCEISSNSVVSSEEEHLKPVCNPAPLLHGESTRNSVV